MSAGLLHEWVRGDNRFHSLPVLDDVIQWLVIMRRLGLPPLSFAVTGYAHRREKVAIGRGRKAAAT